MVDMVIMVVIFTRYSWYNGYYGYFYKIYTTVLEGVGVKPISGIACSNQQDRLRTVSKIVVSSFVINGR
jgi:hypothetical protein